MKKKLFLFAKNKKYKEFCNSFWKLGQKFCKNDNSNTKWNNFYHIIIKNVHLTIMAENERDIVFSESVKAGKRIYYFDVKETRNGEKFLTITESKKIVDGGDMLNPQFSFQKHKIFLYKEDYEKFVSALQKTIKVAKGELAEEDLISEEPLQLDAPDEEIDQDTSIHIDLDF